MKTTKKSLWLSAVSMMLCVVMLLGTTFAWFTDSVTNKDNVIQAGNLDVQFDYRGLTETTAENYKKVDSKALFNDVKWEPGKSFGYDFKVTNAGSLAFDWELSFQNIKSEGGTNNVNIADVLDVYVLDVNANEVTGTPAKLSALNNGVVTSGQLKAEDRNNTQEFSVVIKMKEDANNDYQGAKVTFDIYLRAKQATVEKDGFESSDYDKNATFEGVVNTAEEFTAALQKGGEITLGKDIVLTSRAVVPEGVTVSIDLGGKTISGYGIRNLGTIESLTNGTIVAESGYGLENRANIGLLNCNITSVTSDAINNGTGTWQDGEYVGSNGVIEEIAGGSYAGHADVYASSITGACGLYNGSNAVVKLISGGYFQGSSVAFRNYNKNGIERVTGGFFDCPYMDENGRTFCDSTTIDEVFYNNAPLKVTGGTWYNVGSKINSKIPEGYELVQGDECEMTSRKAYVRYDADTNIPAHWVDDPDGTVYYYWTVEKN